MFPRDIDCLRNMSINTLRKGDDDDDNNNNNNNNNMENVFQAQISIDIIKKNFNECDFSMLY